MIVALRTFLAALTAVVLLGCSESPEELLKKALASRERGDTAAAVVHVKSAIQQAPQDPMLRYHAAVLHTDAFDGVSAEKEIAKALELGLKPDGRIVALRARALWLQGDHKGMLERIPDSPAYGPPEVDAEILAYRGHALAALGKTEEAQQTLQRARASGTSSPIADLLEANILASERKLDAALALVQRVRAAHPKLYEARALNADLVRVAGDPERAVAAYSELLEVHPTNIIALVGRSTLLMQLNRLDEAAKDVRALRAAHRGHFIVHFQEGLLRFRRGQFRTALAQFQRVLKADREHDHARLFEGMSQLMIGNPRSAYHSLRQYVAKRPQDLLGRRMLAIALVELNESARALEILAPVLDAGGNPEYWEVAADAHMRMGNLDQAAHWLDKARAVKPDDARLQDKQGSVQLRRGRTDLALAHFADAARLNARLSTSDSMLVLLNLRVRDFERAMAAVEAMERKAPGHPLAGNLRGLVLAEQGQRDAAVKAFEEVLKKHPKYLPAAVNLARLDAAEGNVERAKKRFQNVLATDRNHMQALMLLAGVEERMGNREEAVRLLERAVGAHPAVFEPAKRLVETLARQGRTQLALTRAEEIVARHPNNAAALEILGNLALRQGEMQRAVAAFAKIVEVHPKSATAYVARARAERAAGLPAEAEATLKKALELQRSHPLAQAMLFELLVQQKRIDAAADFARQLRRDFPQWPAGYVFEGEIALVQNKYREAIGPYRKALELARTGDIAARLYEVRTLAGEGEAALQDLRRWVDDHPKQPLARARLAEALMQQVRYAEAAEQFQVVLQQAPADALAANNLAWAYYKAGDMKRALRFAEGALKLAPENPFVNDTLGWLLFEQGRVAQARKLLAKAAGALPDRPDVRFHYAAALAKDGDREQARRELKAALDSGKSFDERAEAVALLDSLGR